MGTSLYPFFLVDAFTDAPLRGNPCAVIFDGNGIRADVVQRVAQEMNLSEAAVVLDSAVSDFGARYYTPVEEIPLAGHPTLAVTQALLDSGRLRPCGGEFTFTLELRDGPIEVVVKQLGEGHSLILMTQRAPQFLRTYERDEVAAVFGLDVSDLRAAALPQTVSTGTPQLMVPLRSIEALRRARLDVELYRVLKSRGDFFSPHLFVLEGTTSAGATFARHFGVPPDTLEDPFTGSATGGMAAYLWRYGMITRSRFTAEQGHDMGRPGTATVEIDGPPGRPERVRVGGEAVTLIRGTIELPTAGSDGDTVRVRARTRRMAREQSHRANAERNASPDIRV